MIYHGFVADLRLSTESFLHLTIIVCLHDHKWPGSLVTGHQCDSIGLTIRQRSHWYGE